MPSNTEPVSSSPWEDIQTLVERAPSIDTRTGNPYVVYRVVEAEEALTLRERAGVDVEGYVHIIDASAIRHILRKHRREARAGQLPVTPEDIASIPTVVAAPDIIESAGKNKRGMNGVRYRKRVNGYVFVVEEVRAGRKHLATSTMYKYPAGNQES